MNGPTIEVMQSIVSRKIVFVIATLIAAAGIILGVRLFSFRPASAPPSITSNASSTEPQASATKDELFYITDSGDLFSYNVLTGETKTLMTASTTGFYLWRGQRLDNGMLGLEARAAIRGGTTTIAVLDPATGNLVNWMDFASGTLLADNLDFISPDEFVYTQESNPAVVMPDYENVFLVKDGKTTQIGYLLQPNFEYGSMLTHSPDGQYISFANRFYDVASGTWGGPTCGGDQAVWLNNHVLIAQWEHDWDGNLGYCDPASQMVELLGDVDNGAFGVFGDNVIYKLNATATPYGKNLLKSNQIWDYNLDTKTAKLLIDNADFGLHIGYDLNDSGWFVYQPVTSTGECIEGPCYYNGFASGTPMMFNLETSTSSPFIFRRPTDATFVF